MHAKIFLIRGNKNTPAPNGWQNVFFHTLNHAASKTQCKLGASKNFVLQTHFLEKQVLEKIKFAKMNT